MDKCELRKRLLSRLTVGLTLVLVDGPAAALAQIPAAREVGRTEGFVAFCGVVIVGIVANACLIRVVSSRQSVSRWREKWEFSAEMLGGFSWKSVALWSLLSLFMELLMIRWISSEIRIFAYFKNFVLIACFLGFGLGCYLARRKINLLLMAVPLTVLTLIIQAPWRALRMVVSQLPTLIGV